MFIFFIQGGGGGCSLGSGLQTYLFQLPFIGFCSAGACDKRCKSIESLKVFCQNATLLYIFFVFLILIFVFFLTCIAKLSRLNFRKEFMCSLICNNCFKIILSGHWCGRMDTLQSHWMLFYTERKPPPFLSLHRSTSYHHIM